MSVKDKLVLAMVINQAPALLEYWKGSESPLPFHDFLLNCENDAPVKGVLNKLVAKRFGSVVAGLVAIWKDKHIDEYDTFDMYLDSCYTRAKQLSSES